MMHTQTEPDPTGLPMAADEADALALVGGGGSRLGPFWVGPDGLLSPVEPGISPSFSICWRGRTIRARLELTGAGAPGLLLLDTAIGRVPSSAAGTSYLAGREHVFDLVRALPRHLPPEWLISLLPDHRIALAARTTLPSPVAATVLVGELTAILLLLGPYLDVLDQADAGVGAMSADAAGTANT